MSRVVQTRPSWLPARARPGTIWVYELDGTVARVELDGSVTLVRGGSCGRPVELFRRAA
jgi:hypothetical protein